MRKKPWSGLGSDAIRCCCVARAWIKKRRLLSSMATGRLYLCTEHPSLNTRLLFLVSNKAVTFSCQSRSAGRGEILKKKVAEKMTNADAADVIQYEGISYSPIDKYSSYQSQFKEIFTTALKKAASHFSLIRPEVTEFIDTVVLVEEGGEGASKRKRAVTDDREEDASRVNDRRQEKKSAQDIETPRISRYRDLDKASASNVALRRKGLPRSNPAPVPASRDDDDDNNSGDEEQESGAAAVTVEGEDRSAADIDDTASVIENENSPNLFVTDLEGWSDTCIAIGESALALLEKDFETRFASLVGGSLCDFINSGPVPLIGAVTLKNCRRFSTAPISEWMKTYAPPANPSTAVNMLEALVALLDETTRIDRKEVSLWCQMKVIYFICFLVNGIREVGLEISDNHTVLLFADAVFEKLSVPCLAELVANITCASPQVPVTVSPVQSRDIAHALISECREDIVAMYFEAKLQPAIEENVADTITESTLLEHSLVSVASLSINGLCSALVHLIATFDGFIDCPRFPSLHPTNAVIMKFFAYFPYGLYRPFSPRPDNLISQIDKRVDTLCRDLEDVIGIFEVSSIAKSAPADDLEQISAIVAGVNVTGLFLHSFTAQN